MLSLACPGVALLVSVCALAVAFGGPVLALLTAHVPRKPIIVGMAGLFALGQVLCAIAPNFELLLAARVLVALTHGLFFGNATIAARALVPPERRGAALALVLAGVPIANLLGVPIGASIGQAFGWRTSFWCIAGLATLATLAVALLVPRVDEAGASPIPWRAQLKVLGRHQILLSYLAIMVLLIGALAFGTFQVPFLISVTGVPEAATPPYLFAYGIGAIVGVFGGGYLTDWKLMPSAMGTLLAYSAAAALVLVVMHSPVGMFVAMAGLGAVGYAFSTPLQTRIVNASAGAPTLAATFIATAFNLGYAVGALAGAGLLSLSAGYASLPLVGIGAGLLAAAIAFWSWRLDRTHEALP